MPGPEARPLPRETTSRIRWRRLAALALGVLFGVGAANEGARQLLRLATPNIGYALVAQKWRLLLERERPVEWLVLGDSSCNQGLDPQILAGELGGEALNLCTVASSLAVGAAWMLDWHVERLGPPRGVALIHSYHVWHRSLPPFATAHVPLPWGFWRELEPQLAPDARWRFESFLARYLPLYSENQSLKRILMRPWEVRARYRVDARGFMGVARGGRGALEKDARRRLDWLERQPHLLLSPENRAALERIGTLAGRHGFDVFLVNAPVADAIAAAPAFRRYQAGVAGMLAEAAARHPQLHYLEREFVFAGAEMQNGDHLLAGAAARYTRSVAAEIAQARAPLHAAR